MALWAAWCLTLGDIPAWRPGWAERDAVRRQPALGAPGVTVDGWTRAKVRHHARILTLAARAERPDDPLDAWAAANLAEGSYAELAAYSAYARGVWAREGTPDTRLGATESMRRRGALIAGEHMIASDQAVRFLRAVFGIYAGGWIEMRALASGSAGRGPVRRAWFEVTRTLADPAALLSAASAWCAERLDVYVGVLPRRRHGAGKKGDVGVAGCAWAELDFDKVGGHEAAMARVAPLRPDVVVHSGGGIHCYWLFSKAISIDGVNRRRFEEALAQRQRALGGDPVHDSCRILRLPGTLNWKREAARRVVLLHAE